MLTDFGQGRERAKPPEWELVREWLTRAQADLRGEEVALAGTVFSSPGVYAWVFDDGISELSGPFYGPFVSPTSRTPVKRA
jgi:hypothetical protein